MRSINTGMAMIEPGRKNFHALLPSFCFLLILFLNELRAQEYILNGSSIKNPMLESKEGVR